MKRNNSIRLMNSIFTALKQIVKRPSSFRLRLCLSWLMALAMIWQAAMAPVAMAADSRGKARPKATRTKAETSASPAPALQVGSSIILYGPQRFDYQPGPARTVYAQFSLPITSPVAGIVRLQNGATDGTNRATGAIIQLNGVVLSTARTFNLNTATLDLPANVPASNALSVRLVGAPGSYLTLTILAKPIITALSPASAAAGATININGDYFDDSGLNQNIVRFTKTGGGQTTAQVTTAARMQLAVVVPSDAANGPVTVQTAAGTATSPTNFTLLANLPVIADFNPKIGPVGAQVTLTGADLKIGAQNPTVTFAGANNTRLPALVSSATPTQVVVTAPNAAVNGTIELTNAAGTVSSPSPFFVEATQDFQITAAPATASAIQGSLANYVITLTSQQVNFTQLASLSVQGAPAGSTITFTPTEITAGANSTLGLRTAAGLSPGNYQFTIRATALIDGTQTTRTTTATVNVQAAGITTLSGRVLNEDRQPLPGVTASLDGKTATTDAAGSFLLSGVNAGNARPVMVDGRTANMPNATYPVIAEPADIVAGQANTVPYDFILPKIDTQNEVIVVPNQNTMVTTPRVHVEMMIPANANLRNRDGSPVARASITPVEIDRTPAPLPSNLALPMVFTSQPGGAMSDIEMPVSYPNLWGLNPGTQVPLYNFNHDTVQWYQYGTGSVSNDGRMIVPNINPQTGRQYGLRDFSWHGPVAPATGACTTPTCNAAPPDNDPCAGSNVGKNPVAYSSGTKLDRMSDIAFGGARGGLELTRIYTSDLGRQNIQGRFGRGTRDNYAISLTGAFLTGGAGRVMMPSEGNGRQFGYLRTDPDGALVFSSAETVTQLGDVVRKLTNGTYEYRMVSGEVYRFNSSGRLTAMVDRNNNTTTLTYTGNNLTQITDPVGRSITLSYGSNGFVSQATDPLNRRWTYSYDAQSRLAKVTDPLGYTMEYAYDNLAQLTSVKDKRGIVMKQITYDNAGRVTGQQFADGGTETYQYTLSGTVVTGITITDPLGRKTSKRFTAIGYVIEMTDALGQASTVERTLDTNLPTQIKGPCGCPERTRQFDARGNITANTDRLNKTTSYVYEPTFNNLTNLTDRLGRITNYAYDARGNPTSATNALNQTTTFTYDQFGQMTSITDPLNHTTQLGYDTQGNVTAVTDALNHRSMMEYDAVGRLTAIVDPLSRRSEMTYDDLDRILTTKDPSNAVTRYEYDGNGNLTGLTNALNNRWTNNYDKKNRLIALIDPLNRTTQFEYDTADQLTRITSPSKRKVSYTYDTRGQRATITDGIGGLIRFSYDNRGNLTTLTDQRNNTMTFAYDELFRLIAQTDPLGRTTNFGYDSEGNVIATVDRLGRSTNITYDALNRRTSVTYADATVTYTYDAAGRLTKITDTQGGTIDLTYDNSNRLLSEQTPQGLVSYTYNQASQRASMTAANAPVVSYGYDTAGRLSTITQGSETFAYAYDTLSRLQSLQRPNGVTTNYQYDAVNRLARMTHTGPLATIEDFQYGYNADDEIAAITSLASATLLTSARTATAADAANRVPQFGQASYGFDDEGQTVTKTDAQGATTYNWDARGRLTSVALPGGQGVSYSYDALGRRKSRTAGGVTTSFLYDGADVVRDSISGGGGVVDYLNGLGIDQKLRQTGTGGNLYFLQDNLGSTSVLTGVTGSVVERLQYEAFGSSGGSVFSRYGFTGRERDEMTSLLFYRARWMDANQGRFMTEDPIGASEGKSLYQYVGNSPNNYSDAFGLYAVVDDLVFSVGGGLIGLGSQAVSDLIAWDVSDWEDYAGSFVGGAITGEATLYTPLLGPLAPVGVAGASALGSGAGNLTTQWLKNISGKQCGYDWGELGFDTALGFGTGLIPGPKVPYSAVSQQITTKLQRGIISDLSTDTAVKMFVAGAVEDLPGTAVDATIGGLRQSSTFPGLSNAECRCRGALGGGGGRSW
jgi:RHS repeat-associated protein